MDFFVCVCVCVWGGGGGLSSTKSQILTSLALTYSKVYNFIPAYILKFFYREVCSYII